MVLATRRRKQALIVPPPESSRVYRSEGEVQAALREMYPLPSYALLPSVADATGFERGRTIDALVMSCYPSRGIGLYAMEIKVHRSDWLRELKNPAKAEAVCRYCDGFFVVAGAAGIVRDGELPSTWGLIEPKGYKLAIKLPAPKLSPEPMPPTFLAAILRAASEGSQRGIQQQVDAAREEGRREGRESAPDRDFNRIEQLTEQLAALQRSVSEFEQGSGLSVGHPWAGGKALGEKVKLVQSGLLNCVPRIVDDIERLARQLDKSAADYRDAVAKATEIDRHGS